MATIAILIATLFPSSGNIKLKFDIWQYDKVGHFIMFAVWTFLFGIYRALKKQKRPNLIIVFLLASFYGLLIEFLQYVMPTNRRPETYDFIADALGALLAIFILSKVFDAIFKDNNPA